MPFQPVFRWMRRQSKYKRLRVSYPTAEEPKTSHRYPGIPKYIRRRSLRQLATNRTVPVHTRVRSYTQNREFGHRFGLQADLSSHLVPHFYYATRKVKFHRAPPPVCMARRWASAWARTLAKPAGLVMRAAWPASELAQRLHSAKPYAVSAINFVAANRR
jgi:hypothetical protein